MVVVVVDHLVVVAVAVIAKGGGMRCACEKNAPSHSLPRRSSSPRPRPAVWQLKVYVLRVKIKEIGKEYA